MEVFTNASRAVVSHSHFSNIQRGNQYNYNYYGTDKARSKGKRNNEGLFGLPEPRHERKKKKSKGLLDTSEYQEVKRGNIYKDKDVCYSWKLCSNKQDDTEATVYHAKLNITGPFGEKEFTVKTYNGQNAMKEWRRDFARCISDWRGDIPLFGYNGSLVPSLIFCGELVPMAQIEKQIGDVVRFYVYLLHNDLACSRNELWLDSTRGKLIHGPVGPRCLDWFEPDHPVKIPTGAEFLKEDIVIRYFQSTQDDRHFVVALSHCGPPEYSSFPSPNKSMIEVVSSSSKSRIAGIQDIPWWCYNSSLDDRQKMPDGTTRFCLVNNWRCIEVNSLHRRSAWLSQACSVFHNQNIGLSEDLSDFKLMQPSFVLKGAIQKCRQKYHRRELCGPIYLFCKSSPSQDSGQFHFWSLDKRGQEPLTQEVCTYLGLPSKLCIEGYLYQYSWPSRTYQMIRDYQIARGFDPKTTDFTCSLGCPVFEVVSNRFEELAEGEAGVIPV